MGTVGSATQEDIQARPVQQAVPQVAAAARRRRKGLSRLAAMLGCIAIPAAAMATYEYGYAADQYVSEFRFSVKQQHPVRMLSGGGMGEAGSAGNPLLAMVADSEVVVQYLKSRQAVDDIGAKLDLDAMWSRSGHDWWSSMDPSPTAEARVRHWRKVVDPFFDMTTGVVTVKVRQFTPGDALALADASLAAAERRVNDMSSRSKQDAVAAATSEADRAEARLRKAEAAIAQYRNEHQVLFPQLQASTSGTVEGKIRGDLAEAKATMSLLKSQGIEPGSPQARNSQARVSALEEQLADIRSAVAGSGTTSTLASVVSGYSALEVEEAISTKQYEKALSTLQEAKQEASEQQVYLDAFVRPAKPEESTYPIRWRMVAGTALSGFLAWMLGSLLYHGIRDQMD